MDGVEVEDGAADDPSCLEGAWEGEVGSSRVFLTGWCQAGRLEVAPRSDEMYSPGHLAVKRRVGQPSWELVSRLIGVEGDRG